MAATNYTPIQLYNSGTASTAPTNTNLAAGELALNYKDGLLYYKDDANVVQKIGYKLVPIANGGTGTTTAQLAINALVGSVTAGYVVQGNGTNIVLGVPPAIVDTNPIVKGSVDATKKMRFEVDGLTTATTRVITVPNADITIAAAGANSDITSLSAVTGIGNTASTHLQISSGGAVTIPGNVAIGAGTPDSKLVVRGAGTTSHAWTNGDSTGATLLLSDTGTAGGNGGQILFAWSGGGTNAAFAGIKGLVADATGPAGDLVFQTRSTTGNISTRMRINSSGAVTIPDVYSSTTASAANVSVDSNGLLQRSTSALKYKTDVRDLESINVDQLRPVRYKSVCSNDDQDQDHFGLIADEVDAAGITELVNYGPDGQVEGFQYDRLTVVLLKEIQSLRARLLALETI